MDFSDFETSTGGIWRLCAVVDYASKYCLAATVTRFMRGIEAETCLLKALAEACHCLGIDDLTAELAVRDVVDETTGELATVRVPIAVVTDNGGAFKGATFARVFARRPVLRHVRTRIKSPGTNGVIERFFGTAKYEHLYREQITDGLALAAELERSRPSTTRSGRISTSVTGPRPACTSPTTRPAHEDQQSTNPSPTACQILDARQAGG